MLWHSDLAEQELIRQPRGKGRIGSKEVATSSGYTGGRIGGDSQPEALWLGRGRPTASRRLGECLGLHVFRCRFRAQSTETAQFFNLASLAFVMMGSGVRVT